jgi:hypothetical protein
LLTLFEGSFVEFSNAIAAKSNLFARDTERLLKGGWQKIRARQAKKAGAEAEALAVLDEGGESTDARA